MPRITFIRHIGSTVWEIKSVNCPLNDLSSVDDILVSPTSPGTCLLNELGKRGFNIRKANFHHDQDKAANRVAVEYEPRAHHKHQFVYIAQSPQTTLDESRIVTRSNGWSLMRYIVEEADVSQAIMKQTIQWDKIHHHYLLLYYDPNVGFIKHLDHKIACRQHVL